MKSFVANSCVAMVLVDQRSQFYLSIVYTTPGMSDLDKAVRTLDD